MSLSRRCTTPSGAVGAARSPVPRSSVRAWWASVSLLPGSSATLSIPAGLSTTTTSRSANTIALLASGPARSFGRLLVDDDRRTRRHARRRVEAALAIDRDAALGAQAARARPRDARLLAHDRRDRGLERCHRSARWRGRFYCVRICDPAPRLRRLVHRVEDFLATQAVGEIGGGRRPLLDSRREVANQQPKRHQTMVARVGERQCISSASRAAAAASRRGCRRPRRSPRDWARAARRSACRCRP